MADPGIFVPPFEFDAAPPLPEEEFADRLRRIRREAAVAELDAVVVHSDMIGWYHTSNSYLRYICDWMREGMLLVPTDSDGDIQLFSFFSDSVVLPPAGEPMLVNALWQVAPWGRESLDRPGSHIAKAAQGVASAIRDTGLSRGHIGLIGDKTSRDYWDALSESLPDVAFSSAHDIIDRMQRIRSPREQCLLRSAAQLADIGYLAACETVRPGVTDHELYATFSAAQLARGGETGDGYQLGVNEYGTHCGKPYGRVVRDGDLINFYVSNVTYRGYFAQTARMIAVGPQTDEQERVLDMCVDAVRRAEALIAPGVPFSTLHDAAFSAYLERGYLDDATTRTMPFNWAAAPDGSPRLIPEQVVPDVDWERQGRTLRHVYPPLAGPHNPNLGHAVGMPKMPLFNIGSNNTDLMEPGMVFVLHAQWLDPQVAGANVGDCYLVTEDGFENLSSHSPLEPFRV